MANVIKHKRGSGSDPSASDLVVGEVAIRTDVGKLFTKTDSGTVSEIAGGGSDIVLNTLSSSSGTGGGSAAFNDSAYRFTLSQPPSVSAYQLLVSINGIIQKPVTGTSQPSEGFAVDGNDIILGDAPATGADFFILTFKSLGVSEPADNSVTSAKIVDGAIVNADINASAAIAGSKIAPAFTSNISVTNANPNITFLDSDANSDFKIDVNGGLFSIKDHTNADASRLTIDSSGNIGVGTSSPDRTIHCHNSSNTTNVRAKFSNGTTGEGASDGFEIGINGSDPAHAVLVNYENSPMAFFTNASERLRIDSSGNVGIGNDASFPVYTHVNSRNFILGTGSESTALQIHSANNLYGGIYFGDVADRTDAGSYIGSIEYKHGDDYMNFRTNGSERMRIDSSGRVGIGTTSPDRKLDVSGTGNVYGKFQSTNATGAGIEVKDTSEDWLIQADGGSVDGLAFYDLGRSAYRMVINDSGNVGIGTTTMGEGSADNLTVADSSHCGITIRSGSSSGGNVFFTDLTSGDQFQGYVQYNHSDDTLKFGTNKVERLRLSSKGAINSLFNDGDSVGVLHKRHQGSNSHNFFEIRSSGTTTTSGGTLQFAIETDGDVKNTNNSYGSLSDIKLKENIVDAKSQWDDIKALKIRNYNFKSELDLGTYTQIGLIAQEVEETSSGLVVDNIDRDDEGNDLGTITKTLRYSVLHIKALKALQEAITKIETLETKVAALEAA